MRTSLGFFLITILFTTIVMFGLGTWVAATIAEQTYTDLKPYAKTIIDVGNKRYYCQGD